MSIPTNPALYNEVKKEADQKYKRHSLYKSGWIVKTYQSRGGKYKGKKTDGVSTWMKEEWVQVEPYLLQNKKKIPCGVGVNPKACRPLKKVNSKTTPLTISELLKLHDREAILKAVRQKQKNMDKRINWRTLKIS